MKKLLTIFALGSVALLSADQYNQPYEIEITSRPSYSEGSYYQGQPRFDSSRPSYNEGNYYQNQGNARPSYNEGSYYQDQQGNYDSAYGAKTNNQKAASSDYSESQLQSSEKKYPLDIANTLQDRQINAKIRDRLNGWFTKDYETLVIKTANGVVVLVGTVDKPELVQKITDKVKDVDGVRTISNQLSVKNK